MKSILSIGKLFSVRLVAIALTFVQTVVMTRVLGGDLFGLLSFSLSISALIVLILSMGLDQVLLRSVARVGAFGVIKSRVWHDTFFVLRRYLVPAVVIFTFFSVFVSLATDFLGLYRITLIAVFLSIPVLLIRKYLEAICLGTKQVVKSILGSQIIYPIAMISGFVFLLLSGDQPTPLSASVVYFLSCCLSMMASIFLMVGTIKQMTTDNGKPLPENQRLENTEFDPKKTILSGVHFSLVSLGFVLGQHLDVILVGAFSTPEEVSFVRVAARVAEAAALFRAIILLQYKPVIAQVYGDRDLKRLQNIVDRMVLLFVSSGLPLTALLWFFADDVMSVFGPEFIVAAWSMRIYVLGVLVLLLCGPCNAVLALTDHESTASKIVWISIAVNVLLDIILIPLYGAVGCAVANVISMLFLGIGSAVMAKKALGIETSIFQLVVRKIFAQ